MVNEKDFLEIEELKETLLDDGKGNTHSRYCPECGNRSMYIERPNVFKCRVCYKDKWVVLDLEKVLNSI